MNEKVSLLDSLQTGTLTNLGAFMSQVYAWMTLGLFTTAAVAFVFAYSPPLQAFYLTNPDLVSITFILQLLLVIGFSFLINKISAPVAALLFMIYSASVGFTFASLFLIYTESSIFTTFLATAGTFAVMSAIGFITKVDLTKIGGIAIMGLIGLIIGSLVNIFLQSTGFSIFLTYAGIFVFMVLIAYDTQKIKKYAALAEQGGRSVQLSIIAALSLYLDFINLFIRLLSLFGKRK